jgi:hypothetical protein
MAAIVKGTTLMISFGSYVYTGYVPESMTVSFPNGNVKVIRDQHGATYAKLLMDPGTRVQGTFIIIGATGSITPPIHGATVTLTPPTGTSTAFFCESAEVAFSAEESRLTLDLIKEDGMTYT